MILNQIETSAWERPFRDRLSRRGSLQPIAAVLPKVLARYQLHDPNQSLSQVIPKCAARSEAERSEA